MGPSPILSIIHTVTFDTMLNFNGDNNGHGIKYATCKQTLNTFNKKLVGTVAVPSRGPLSNYFLEPTDTGLLF